MSSPRLFRIVLQVPKLQAAADFYTKLLGSPGRRIAPSRHYFDAGSAIIGLLDAAAEGRAAQPNPEYIYFAVDDLDSLHKAASELGALSKESIHGSPAGDIVRRPWGERSFYAYDPGGNGLCFVDAATLFTGVQ